MRAKSVKQKLYREEALQVDIRDAIEKLVAAKKLYEKRDAAGIWYGYHDELEEGYRTNALVMVSGAEVRMIAPNATTKLERLLNTI